MFILSRISRTLPIFTRLCFNYNQPPRDSTLQTESEFMLPYSINFLHDNKGAVRCPKQLGRGPGSGKGYFLHNIIEKQQREDIRDNYQGQEVLRIQDSKADKLQLQKGFQSMAG